MVMTDRSDEPDTPSGKNGAIRGEYDWTSTAPSTAVIETVAIACNRKPTRLEPLYEAVDPDALDALVRSSGDSPVADGTVTFEVADKSVTVHSGGTVVVRPVEARAGDAQE
jgi:hypothetical protein